MSQKLIAFNEKFDLSLVVDKKDAKKFQSLFDEQKITYRPEKMKDPDLLRYVLSSISLKNVILITKLNQLQTINV